MNNRTHDSHYPWTKKRGAGHRVKMKKDDFHGEWNYTISPKR